MIKLTHFKGIVGTPALPILVRGWADILEAGHVSVHTWPLNHTGECFLAVDSVAGPVGVIGFEHTEWAKEICVTLGYVLHAHRHSGIYNQLWAALVKHAHKAGALRITGGANTRNLPMLATAKQQGRVTEGVVFNFYLAPKPKRRKGI